MGASCIIHFVEFDRTVARIYLHWGGDTFDEVAETMRDFIAANADNPDPRWADASYLAAKFVVHSAEKIMSSPFHTSNHPLDFLSVGVVESDSYADFFGVFECGDTSAPYELPRMYAGPTSYIEEMREIDPVAATS